VQRRNSVVARRRTGKTALVGRKGGRGESIGGEEDLTGFVGKSWRGGVFSEKKRNVMVTWAGEGEGKKRASYTEVGSPDRGWKKKGRSEAKRESRENLFHDEKS